MVRLGRMALVGALGGVLASGTGAASALGEGPSWCPEAPSPEAHPDGRLRVATWNLGRSAAVAGSVEDATSVAREAQAAKADARIRCHVRLIDADVLALQAVEGIDALSRVVDRDVYDVWVSERGAEGTPNTAIAVKKGLDARRWPPLTALEVSPGDRWGTMVSLVHREEEIEVLSVHLDPGCPDPAAGGQACDTLRDQFTTLEEWIDARVKDAYSVIVLGTFNRRLDRPDDPIWAGVADGFPAPLETVTRAGPVGCHADETAGFPVDYQVIGPLMARLLDRSSVGRHPPGAPGAAAWASVSDHCPVIADYWLP